MRSGYANYRPITRKYYNDGSVAALQNLLNPRYPNNSVGRWYRVDFTYTTKVRRRGGKYFMVGRYNGQKSGSKPFGAVYLRVPGPNQTLPPPIPPLMGKLTLPKGVIEGKNPQLSNIPITINFGEAGSSGIVTYK